jgi:threonine/homoserine/homoserine lactone efflux protein
MGDAIGQVLAFAVVVGLSPIPIIGVVLMLGTPRARTNGPAFVLGWVVGLSVVGTIVLLASGGADATDDGGPAGWVSTLQLLLGLLLLLIAAKYWRGRPRGGAQPEMPAWMERLDTFTPARAAGFGVLLSAVNPKNLVLVVAAAAAIAQTGASAGAQAVALAVFVVIGTLGTGVPVALYLMFGDRSRETLDDVKDWMGRNNAVIMVVLCLVIGAKLIGDAISGLAG